MNFCACSCADMRISCRCLYAEAGTTIPEERGSQRLRLPRARQDCEVNERRGQEARPFSSRRIKKYKKSTKRFQGSSTRCLSLQQEEYIELWLVVMINLVPSAMQDFAQQKAARGRMNKSEKMRKQKSEDEFSARRDSNESQREPKRPEERGQRQKEGQCTRKTMEGDERI